MKKLILKLNNLLIKNFGIPSQNQHTPSPLDTLIGTILSQNTNDNNSYKAYMNLKNNFANWSELSELTAAQIESYIRVAGLGRQKSNAIKKILTHLSKNHSTFSLDFLNDMDDASAINVLVKYEGVGLKTASCVLLFSMRRNVCPVDTHVHRTLNRIGVVNTASPDKTSIEINKNLPDGIAHTFHTNLIKLGREVCRPALPDCSLCPVKSVCKYENKNLNTVKRYKKNTFLLLDNL